MSRKTLATRRKDRVVGKPLRLASRSNTMKHERSPQGLGVNLEQITSVVEVKRFLVEDGAGTDARVWKLAQSLSALYPKESDEKRWVDGVLARKKGWGF